MKNPQEIEQILAQCSGTENYYRHFMGFVYTDGVQVMAELCQAHWLLDSIGIYQPILKHDPKNMLQWMQFWTLTVKDNTVVLICERDSGDVAIRQEIEYTDFPLAEIKVWLEAGEILDEKNQPKSVMVAMLPSER